MYCYRNEALTISGYQMSGISWDWQEKNGLFLYFFFFLVPLMVFLDRILRRSFSHNFAVSGTKSTFNGLLIAAIISDGGFIRRSKAHCVVFGRAAAFFVLFQLAIDRNGAYMWDVPPFFRHTLFLWLAFFSCIGLFYTRSSVMIIIQFMSVKC